jgi:hypothetical protein
MSRIGCRESNVETDPVLREAIATILRQEGARFLNRRGPRQVGLFVDSLAALAILTDDAVERTGVWGRESYGAEYLSHHEEINAALRSLICPQPLIEHLRNVAISCIQESLAVRVATG